MQSAIIWIVTMLLAVAVGSMLVARRYVVGPVIWLRKALHRNRAEEGADRRELLARVQQLLPLANENNMVFSLHHENSTHGGSKVSVVTNTYYAQVFVADGDALWVIPIDYERHKKSYVLGQPGRITAEVVKSVRLTGKRGKNLIATFYLEVDDRTIEIAMDMAPYCFRKNPFYPFDMMQPSACDTALETVEKIARAACDLTPEDLEAGRLKDECSNYGLYAGLTAIIGVLAAPAESIVPTVICFVIAFAFLGLIVVKKRVPKASAVVVIAAMVMAAMLAK